MSQPDTPRVLVAGWFSFANGHATAGDLMSCDVVVRWLAEAGIACDHCTDPPFTGGLDWRTTDPAAYSHVIFVCGPFGRGELEAAFLTRFARCRLIGLNLSMSTPLEDWNPFDLLIERDSNRAVNVDLVFSAGLLPPVVGLCLVEAHEEAPRTADAHAAMADLLKNRDVAVVPIDTRLDVNQGGLGSPREVEALISRMDVLATTRLHGLVLALKNGVPAVAVDVVPGGGKITRQCAQVGWPNVISIDRLDRPALEHAFDFALSPDARRIAREAAARAAEMIPQIKSRLLSGIRDPAVLDCCHAARLSEAGITAFLADLATMSPPPAPEPCPPPPRRSLPRIVLRRAAALLSRT
jgi:hypothetical protein